MEENKVECAYKAEDCGQESETDRQTDRHRETERCMNRQFGIRQTESGTAIQPNRPTDRVRKRQTARPTDRHRHKAGWQPGRLSDKV